MSKFKLAELFAGTGAFSLAFENTKKVETIYANDFCNKSEIIFNENFSIKLDCKNLNDIDENTIPKMDILTGGFPCQPFSIAGEQKGFEDERSNVFWKILKIIKKHQPKVVILENVKNLQAHDDGNTFKTITKEIDKLKYFYKFKILNTSEHSIIPQNRERIYIICFKNKEDCDKFEFPEEVNDKDKIELNKMMESTIPDKYYYKDDMKIWPALTATVKTPISKNVIYQYRRYYVRENKNNVCPTLTANMGTGGHNVPIIKDAKGIRKLIPRECFNLQGFPKTYKLPKMSDAPLYKLAGNAVSYPIVEKIAKKIIDIIYKSNNIEVTNEEVIIKKKKKSKDSVEVKEVEVKEVQLEEVVIKKKKKSKDSVEVKEEVKEVQLEEIVIKKKKKSKEAQVEMSIKSKNKDIEV
jgi:DNA (cytosine-5)-methyltransferase 1